MPPFTVLSLTPGLLRSLKNINSPNVHLIEAAVGNENRIITFNKSSGIEEFADWNQSGSIGMPKEHTKIWSKVKFEDSIDVP